jgi:hypothetical protein
VSQKQLFAEKAGTLACHTCPNDGTPDLKAGDLFEGTPQHAGQSRDGIDDIEGGNHKLFLFCS